MDWLTRPSSPGAASSGRGTCQRSDKAAWDLAAGGFAVMVDLPDCGLGAARRMSEVSRAVACGLPGPVSTKMLKASAAAGSRRRPARLAVNRRNDRATLRKPGDEAPARHFGADHWCDIAAVLGRNVLG